MKTDFSKETKSEIETKEIANGLAKTLKGGEVIALFGDLGAGKTIFAKGLAEGLGIKAEITSPTFIFIKEYPAKIADQEITFYHLDLYRGESPKDFEALGLEELIGSNSIVVIEWAQKIEKILPEKRIDILIKKVNENARRITIKRN